MTPIVLSGLVVGLVFGYALQRGRFCMNSASRDALLLQDYTLLKAVGVALLVQLIGFAILQMTGILTLAPKPFWWGANLVGSFTFGVGMVLAGACASGVTYRTGEGMVSAIVAAIGLTLAAMWTATSFLNPIAANLQSSTLIKTADGANLTLDKLLGVPYAYLALGIAVVAIAIWAYSERKARAQAPQATPSIEFKHGWGWLATGIAIGLIAVVAFPISVAAGRNSTIGITDGWMGIYKAIFMGGSLGWAPLFIIGTIVGALVAAVVAKEFKVRMPKLGTLVQVFVGGLLMGFGAVCSGGCNVTHILGGLPQLSLGSILATLAIVGGAWITAHLIFNVFRKSPAL